MSHLIPTRSDYRSADFMNEDLACTSSECGVTPVDETPTPITDYREI